MALPLDPTQPGALTSPGLGDDEIRALKQWLPSVWGFPISPNAVATPGSSGATDGTITLLKGPIFPSVGEPGMAGQIQRNVNSFRLNNGLAVGSLPLILDKGNTPATAITVGPTYV